MSQKTEERCNLFTGELRGINKMAVLGIVFLGEGAGNNQNNKQLKNKDERKRKQAYVGLWCI